MTLAARMDSPELLAAARIARARPQRSLDELPASYWMALSAAKAGAVARDDQELAKAAWVLEAVGRTQDAFVQAFNSVRGEAFKAAWDSLGEAEGGLSSLERHFTGDGDDFGLRHMLVHIPQFQSLFPYRWGLSPAFLYKRLACSVCGQRITLRSNCGHISGEIYDGQMCGAVVEDMEILHVSLVEAPAQRYSVMDLDPDEPGFELVRFAFNALRSPWDAWTVRREERRAHHPLFRDVGHDDPCPCASGKKYKRCCLKSETVFPHFDFVFEHDPPPEMHGLFARPPGHDTMTPVGRNAPVP